MKPFKLLSNKTNHVFEIAVETLFTRGFNCKYMQNIMHETIFRTLLLGTADSIHYFTVYCSGPGNHNPVTGNSHNLLKVYDLIKTSTLGAHRADESKKLPVWDWRIKKRVSTNTVTILEGKHPPPRVAHYLSFDQRKTESGCRGPIWLALTTIHRRFLVITSRTCKRHTVHKPDVRGCMEIEKLLREVWSRPQA